MIETIRKALASCCTLIDEDEKEFYMHDPDLMAAASDALDSLECTLLEALFNDDCKEQTK